jgi:uncharacterized DUF497 family protein
MADSDARLMQLLECTGFQWDDGNIEKNWLAHAVHWSECEEVFFKEPLLIVADIKHSDKESRFYGLSQTDQGRLLFLAFTVRERQVRVISARDMSRRERREYERFTAAPTGADDTGV